MAIITARELEVGAMVRWDTFGDILQSSVTPYQYNKAHNKAQV